MPVALPNIEPQAALDLVGMAVGTDQPGLFLIVGGAVLARLLGFLIVIPFFGSMNIPLTARVAFAVVMAAVITPFVMSDIGESVGREVYQKHEFTYVFLLVTQVLVGLMLGFVGAFVFYAIESAGRIIDTQRGSNMTDIIAPQSGERTSPTGQWLMMFALMVLLLSGLHLPMLEGLIQSFSVFPPTVGLEWLGDPIQGGADPKMTGTIKEFAWLSGSSLELTMKIAAPAMLTLMLTDVLLGIVNRGAPQVNVFALSQVVKGPIGIAALMVALIPIGSYIQNEAIPSIVEGEHSITAMAERMRDTSDAVTRAEAEGR